MFSRVLKPVANVAARNGAKNFSVSSQNNYKVTVVGSAGGIGQPLSLLLKQDCLITHLSIYDISPANQGIAADLSHINTGAKISEHHGEGHLEAALKDSHIIIVPAGLPRKPGMTRDDLFKTNANIVKSVACATAKCSPKAVLGIVTNPVNALVPLAAEVLKQNNVYDPSRLFGVTTLDIVRACAFIGDINKINASEVYCPVIGGHAGTTIIPLLSQAKPAVKLSDQKDIEKLTDRIQNAGTEVVQAKAASGAGGSATLSMAFAAARIVNTVLRGLNGEKDVTDFAYVESALTEAPFFSSKLLFGKCGVEKNLGLGKLNAYEEALVKAAVPQLCKDCAKGVEFARAK